MKYLLSIICIFLLVNISIISANGSEKILNVPYSYQGSTQWCYLHGISMVLKYYGYSVEPMDIASKWNLGHDEGSGSIFSQLMNQLNGFMNTYNINATVIPKTIGDASFFLTDFSGYKLYIDGGSPVMVCGQDTTLGIWPNGGHCILIVGYEEGDTNYLYIHDPSGFFTGKWPGAIQTGNEEAFVKVPWSEYKQYFENIINNVLMYIVIFSGATPNPLPGNLWIQDSDIVQGPAALRLNNYPYFKPNRCFDKKSQIYVYFEIFNPTDVDRKYQASIQIRDQSDAVVYQMQPIKTDYCIRKNSLRQHYDIPYLELCNIKDGDYKCYWRLHAINDLNIETDPPLDEIGPIPLSFASQSGSLITSQNSQEHNDNTCVLTAFQSKIIISANVVPIPVIVDIKFKAHYALFESANNIKIRLYIDAYSTENTTTDDTGKTPLSFKIILRNSSGGLIEESNWKSTDTDGDGIFGDPSGYGGSIPFFESQNLNDDIILIFVKWEINQTFGPEQSQDIYCGTIFTNIPIPEGEKPIASITSISPNPAIQEQDSIIFTGSGDDPDTQGTDPKIRTYRWTSDLGKIDGNLELYNGPDASPPQLSASELKVGNHTITLSVQDNEGDWSDGVTAQLIIKSQLPGQADYKVTQFNFTGNTTDLQSGDPLTITLNTTNDGLGSGGSNSFTKVYLTTKQSGDPRSDGVAFSTMPINDLAKGASQGATYGASYPSTSAGTYYLAACADADNQIAESNENNNWLYNSQSLQFKGGPFSASGKIVDQNQNPIPSNNIEIDIDKLDANGTIIVHQVYYTNANGEWQANSCFEAGERYKISPFWSGHSGIFNPPYYYFSSVDRSYADLNFIYCLQAYIFSGIITRESNGQPFTKCVVCSIWAGQTRYLPVDELGKYSSIIVTDDLLTSIFLYPIPEEKIYEWPTFTPINYDISLSGGSRYDLNFQAHFANSCSISGKAVDNNGKAMQGLEIYMRRMPEDPVIAASVKTKNDGTFIFEDVLKGYPYKLYPDTSETIFEPLLFNISNLSNDMSDFIFTGLSKPLADFSANPTTGSLPLNVFFTDKSSSSDAPIKNWLWDFGDGDTTTTQHPTHIYNQLGKFTVKLTVSSDAGNSIKEMPDYIVVYENRSPFMPTNIYPFNNQDGAPITTILVGSTFCDPDFGDVISKSQFQIAQNDKTFDQLKWDSGLIDSVTYYQIPLNANLENNTKFKWRCRYQDNKGSWSAWSNETAFNTMNMPTPTPTPTPTSSPTITPTPTPILLAKYTFDNPSDEGWKPFPIPGGTYINDPLGAFYIANTTISTLSAVGILDSDTTYSIYGRWELNTNSPISPCEENYLYRARYWLRTTQTDKNKVPQVRMQWNNYPPQIFALLQVDKGLNAIGTVFAPYDSYYYKSSTDSYGGQNYLIYFDLVDFTPEQSGDVYCDELEVTRQTPLTTGGILVWEQDSNDDFKTWTPVGVSGIFDDVTRGRGNGSIWLESPGPLGAKPLYYGGWSSPYAETSPSFQSDSLYKAIFTLHSESVDAQKHLPMIRLRLSNKTFDWIGMICVRQDVGTYGHMPSHSGTDYYLYMPSPPNLSGIPGDKSDSMVINFDIVDGSENEYGRVYLDHVQVWKYPLQ